MPKNKKYNKKNVIDRKRPWIVDVDSSKYSFKSTDDIKKPLKGTMLSSYYPEPKVVRIKDKNYRWTCCDFILIDCLRCTECWWDELGTGCHTNGGFNRDVSETKCPNSGLKNLGKMDQNYWGTRSRGSGNEDEGQ